MAVTEQSIMGALAGVIDPNTGKDFVSSKCIKNLNCQGGEVRFDLELGYPAQSQMAAFSDALAMRAVMRPAPAGTSSLPHRAQQCTWRRARG